MRALTHREMLDLLIGAKILGCGGGGDEHFGRSLIDGIYDSGKQITLIDIMEIPDDASVCIIGEVGGGVGREIKEKLQSYLIGVNQDSLSVRTETIQRAVRELETVMETKFFTYVPSEIGPGNTILPMYLAALEGKPAIDGDTCGRAKPETALSTTHIAGIPVTPLTITNVIGDLMILKNAVDDYRAEDIARHMAVASGGNVSVARAPNTVARYKQAIVRGSVSRTIRLGSIVRTSREDGLDVVESILKADSDCIRLFAGRIASWTRKEEGGFMWGELTVEGTGSYQEQRLDIWYKNEYLIAWRNGKPYATCPDSICIVDAASGDGLSTWIENLSTYERRDVEILGFKANKLWRTEKGTGLFGPKHFGYDIQYTPLEGHSVGTAVNQVKQS
jgi:DUF917 family protein